MKLVVSLVVVGLLGGAAAWWFTRGTASGKDATAIPADGLFAVKRGDLQISLTENGTLVAKESKKVTPEFRNRGKITFIVEEGKVVAEGDELCKFDTTELTQQIDQIQLDISKATADVATAKSEVEIQAKQNDADIKKATVGLEKARKEQERYIEGDAPQEIKKIDIAIKESTTAYEKAAKKLDDSKKLFEKEFIEKKELEQDQQDWERQEVVLDRAKTDKLIFDKYTYPMALRDKELAVEDAQLGLDTVQKRAESTLRQKEVTFEQNEKRLTKLEEQLKQRQEDLAKMILKAPCPGIVIYGDPRYGWYDTENLKIGGEVWSGNTLFTIPDLRVMQVKVQIHEADINKIKLEMTVRVTMDTYPGLLMTGKITKIAAIAAGSNSPFEGNQEVKKFDVEVTLEGRPDVELKPGISAKAEIMIDTRKEALYVPLQCVFLEGGKQWCYTIDAERQPAKREVKPGLSNDSYVEILEGLAEAEQVLLYNPSVPTGVAPETKEEEPAAPPAAPAAAPSAPPAGGGPTGG